LRVAIADAQSELERARLAVSMAAGLRYESEEQAVNRQNNRTEILLGKIRNTLHGNFFH
jgi:hypothetical protein